MSYVIALDLDGCVYHYERTARYLLRRRYTDRGEKPPAALSEPSRNWDWIQDHVSKEDWDWLWSEGVEQGLFRHGHVVGGSIEGIEALSKIGDVVLVTARPKNAVRDTLAWLTLHFDKAPLAGIEVLSHGQRKSTVRPLPNVFIDDGPHNLTDVIENTPLHVRVICFDRPWNQDWPPDGAPPISAARYRRAFGWRDVVRLVREAKGGWW